MMTNTFNHNCKSQTLSLGGSAYWSLFAVSMINSDREPEKGLS